MHSAKAGTPKTHVYAENKDGTGFQLHLDEPAHSGFQAIIHSEGMVTTVLTDFLLSIAQWVEIDAKRYSFSATVDWGRDTCTANFSGNEVTFPCNALFSEADKAATECKQSFDLVFLKYVLIAAALKAGVSKEDLSSAIVFHGSADMGEAAKESELRTSEPAAEGT